MRQLYYQVGGVKVCWHAIVRYLERFKGRSKIVSQIRSLNPDISDYRIVKILESKYDFSAEKLCDEIVTDELWQRLFSANMMDGTYPYGYGIDIIFVNKHIITITKKTKNLYKK